MISVKTTSTHIQNTRHITVPSPTGTLYVHIFGFIIRHVMLHGMYGFTVKWLVLSAEESYNASQVLFLLPQLFVFILNCYIIY